MYEKSQSHLTDLVNSHEAHLAIDALERLLKALSQSHLTDLVNSHDIEARTMEWAKQKSQSHLTDLVNSHSSLQTLLSLSPRRRSRNPT